MLGTRPCGLGGSYELSVNAFFQNNWATLYYLASEIQSQPSFNFRRLVCLSTAHRGRGSEKGRQPHHAIPSFHGISRMVERGRRNRAEGSSQRGRYESVQEGGNAETSGTKRIVYRRVWWRATMASCESEFHSSCRVGQELFLLTDLECVEGAKGGTRRFVEEIWKYLRTVAKGAGKV